MSVPEEATWGEGASEPAKRSLAHVSPSTQGVGPHEAAESSGLWGDAPLGRSTVWEAEVTQSSFPFIPTTAPSALDAAISSIPHDADDCRLVPASLPGDEVRSSVVELVAHEVGSVLGSFWSSAQVGCFARLSAEDREGQCLEFESILPDRPDLVWVQETWALLKSATKMQPQHDSPVTLWPFWCKKIKIKIKWYVIQLPVDSCITKLVINVCGELKDQTVSNNNLKWYTAYAAKASPPHELSPFNSIFHEKHIHVNYLSRFNHAKICLQSILFLSTNCTKCCRNCNSLNLQHFTLP